VYQEPTGTADMMFEAASFETSVSNKFSACLKALIKVVLASLKSGEKPAQTSVN
jgi:hypothetical protein